jgi:hypothetical protein
MDFWKYLAIMWRGVSEQIAGATGKPASGCGSAVAADIVLLANMT